MEGSSCLPTFRPSDLPSDDLCEIAWRHPLWITGSAANRAATAGMPLVTRWTHELELATEDDWLGMLDTLETHHGELASDPPMSKLLVYGAAATEEAASALRAYDFTTVLPTSSGFIALRA